MNCPYCDTAMPTASSVPDAFEIVACSSCLNAFGVRVDGDGPQSVMLPGVEDVRALGGPDSYAGALLAEMNGGMDHLPVLPEVSQLVTRIVQDPESSMNDLVDAISQDQAIALKVLRVANSALYGGLHDIKDLRTACARLGMKTVANTAHAIANEQLFGSRNMLFKVMMKQLWHHTLAASHCANELAAMVAEPRTDALFVCGLVHDVGIVVLLDALSRSEHPLLKTLCETPRLVIEVVDRLHALAGLHAIQHWGLPREFRMAVFCHHQPDMVPEPDQQAMTHIICMANCIAMATGFGFGPDDEIPSLVSLPSAKYLGLSDVKIATLRVDLEDRLGEFIDALAGV
ncbi:MAG: HDOD domain-containing protein [bacterium]|nr:HDOD domain-containing protein [bacterium]